MSVIQLVRMLDTVEPGLRAILLGILEEMERHNAERVTKAEVNALTDAVHDLAQAQARTEARIHELAQAQKTTEERLATLTERVDGLAVRMDQLTERMDQLTARMDQLTVRVDDQAKRHKDLARQVGGIANSMGYGMEDSLMPYLPAYARATWGVTLTSVERTYLEYPDGRTDEINILGQGHDAQGQPVAVVAECKIHPNLNDAKRFAALVARARRLLPGTVLPLLLGASIPPATARAIAAQWPELHLAHTSAVRMAAGPVAYHPGANFCT